MTKQKTKPYFSNFKIFLHNINSIFWLKKKKENPRIKQVAYDVDLIELRFYKKWKQVTPKNYFAQIGKSPKILPFYYNLLKQMFS